MTVNDWATLILSAASLIVAFVALLVAVVAMKRSDRNASGATLVTLYEAFRQGWARFQSEGDAERSRYEMAELMNTFEIACAIHQDRSIHGHSRELLEEYLCDTLSKFANDTEAVGCIRAMMDGPTTFKFLARFYDEMSRSGRVPTDPLVIRTFQLGRAGRV
jgi:hypothetical protein